LHAAADHPEFLSRDAELSLRRGFNPDVPPHLNKVTETV
jgi:glucosamine--fructose-6-phosphate aminotransferase (isomerizing)